MTTSTIIILLVIGVSAGILSGLVGVGGGLIIVPALVYFLAFSQKAAQGTSLGILLLPVGILAVTQYYQKGYIDVKVVLYVSIGFLIGGFLGSKLAVVLPVSTVKKVFAIMMLVTALKMLFLDKVVPESPGAKHDVQGQKN
ncbi:sulfite exporter TauE/SafE family protein [Parasediminibacterium sp. JCM 36343]|uniref:sulfite exporter TauE/SafE family protein n=1 Tax=Parasediminibacterium sp. JCM 36343 TaxID=3374279 RepID=UPI003978B0D6